jgi:hypothetical protein
LRRQTEPVEIGETRHAVHLSPIRAYRAPRLRPLLRQSTIRQRLWVRSERLINGTRIVALDVALSIANVSGPREKNPHRTICDFF